MIKILLKSTIMLSILTTSLFSLEKEDIKPYMTKNIDNVITILRDKKITEEEKFDKIFILLDSVFDYKLMSKISLGRSYKKLKPDQKEKFTIAFEKKLKDSYVDKLKLYTNQITKVKDIKLVKKNRIIFYTDLVGDESVFSINYKFYKNKKNQWFIYDVQLLGVSILQTYKQQFKAFLKTNSISDLIKSM